MIIDSVLYRQIRSFLPTYVLYLSIATAIIMLLYIVVGNYGYLRGMGACLSFKNLVLRRWGHCFRAAPKETCQELEHGYVYGWCNDADNYGPMAGTREGPYVGNCADWSWKKDECPPITCKGNYPYGIGKQAPFQKWGWCADNDRAMKGSQCGPTDGTCNNWIWNEYQCPDTCPTFQEDVAEEAIAESCGEEVVASHVCGKLEGGNKLQCPPTVLKNKCDNVCGNVRGPDGVVRLQCPPPSCSCKDDCICDK
jgi:hypothetical protein